MCCCGKGYLKGGDAMKSSMLLVPRSPLRNYHRWCRLAKRRYRDSRPESLGGQDGTRRLPIFCVTHNYVYDTP